MRTFMNKKRKLVNQSNQQEYTRKRQNIGEDANGISPCSSFGANILKRLLHEQM